MELLLIICGLIGIGIWVFLKRSGKKASAFSSLDQGNEWLRAEGIIPESVHYSAYNDPCEVSIPGATVIVGVGQDAKGTSHGFAFEKHPDGSVEGRILASPAIAMRDKQASGLARAGGDPMMAQLGAWSLQWVAEGRPVADYPSASVN